MKLIGIQRVEYTKQNGYHVLGYKLHMSTPATWNDSIGEITDTVFVSDQVYGSCDHLAVGDEISIAYNKYGKVSAISVIG